MSLLNERLEALEEIVAAAGSGKSASETLERMMEAGRVAIGAGCLVLAAADELNGGVRSWTSSDDASSGLLARCVEACIAELQPDAPSSRNGFVVAKLGCPGGINAALVCDRTSEKQLFDLVSGYISMAVANERLSSSISLVKEKSDRKDAEVAAVYEIGQATYELDVDRLLPLITEKAAAVMQAQACSLVLRDDLTGPLRIRASWGLAANVVDGTRISLGHGVDGIVAQTGEAMLITDLSSDPRFASASVKPRKDIVSSMCAPLKDESQQVIGVLNIRRHVPEPAFTEDDLRVFCIFAAQKKKR